MNNYHYCTSKFYTENLKMQKSKRSILWKAKKALQSEDQNSIIILTNLHIMSCTYLFVLQRENNRHHFTFKGIVIFNERLRNKNESWTIQIMKKGLKGSLMIDLRENHLKWLMFSDDGVSIKIEKKKKTNNTQQS